jgi:tRNA 2-selenouridine synthase
MFFTMAAFKSMTIAEALQGTFDAIVDVRTPAEFADDHWPGAINLPVLSDDERIQVGTLYQASPFEAQKLGAMLISRNIAQHLDTALRDKPKSWRPCIYCWRGGMRSGAMAHILAEIGWRTTRLHGGYKTYRHHVLESLETLPAQFQWRVICGPTGSGKSRLLQALGSQGAQVLDLEQLACHRGSLLGSLPGAPQPSQKTFETRLWDTLRRFDPRQPVFVEAESRNIGVLRVPTALLTCMRLSPCLVLETPLHARVAMLMEDYAHFLHSPSLLAERLALLTELHGHRVIERWNTMATAGDWTALVQALLETHYDPAYHRSSHTHFEHLQQAERIPIPSADANALHGAALACIHLSKETHS